MIDQLRRLLQRSRRCSSKSSSIIDGVQLATATLLIEIARADHTIETAERSAIEQLLRNRFSLDETALKLLMDEAERSSEQSVSLYPYTRLINDHFKLSEKREIIELLWRVAFADGHKDDHEEHQIRKIASLIYLPHRDFIAARQQASRATKHQ
ncbi:hypothetical protein BOW53_12720 [Solemya pervernicosa gill symbiont]|uniref:Co-chaperone DjlA N-terminal domain-containing protein n=2 Tax=Gammaproteobacteria incertae sedis TaxID=118884 RepID=A0A1T2L240_9GAMM|nr:TerB family tellurite resistance protein [Candidatus Reidiella endopervernicosa]OOZ39159.1 hypothetical protein BOW53_12720 [Solemya pervernicosa gill symbiont]QKQ28015.1 TerB family tellurite resistance protein [Candidatus Reidiella endopervernicosa]